MALKDAPPHAGGLWMSLYLGQGTPGSVRTLRREVILYPPGEPPLITRILTRGQRRSGRCDDGRKFQVTSGRGVSQGMQESPTLEKARQWPPEPRDQRAERWPSP